MVRDRTDSQCLVSWARLTRSVMQSVVFLSENLPERSEELFRSRARCMYKDSISILGHFEEYLTSSLAFLELRSRRLQSPERSVQYRFSPEDERFLVSYRQAVSELFASENVNPVFSSFIRTIERRVILPSIGPDIALEVRHSMQSLSFGGATSDQKKKYLVGRMNAYLNDLPAARSELDAALRSVECRRSVVGCW